MFGLPLTGKLVFGSYLREFWVMQDVYGEGYAYLAMIDAKYRHMVKAICRSYPTIQSLCALDAVLFAPAIWNELYLVNSRGKLQFCDDARQGAVSWAEIVQAKQAYDRIIPSGWLSLLDKVVCVERMDDWFVSPLSGVVSVDSELAVRADIRPLDEEIKPEVVELIASTTQLSENQNRYFITAKAGDLKADRWYQAVVPDMERTSVQLLVPKALEMQDSASRRLVGLVDLRVADTIKFKSRLPVQGFSLIFQWDIYDSYPRWSDATTSHLLQRKGQLMEFENGFCYLTLVRPEDRGHVAMMLGCFPTLGDLLSIPVEYCLSDVATVSYSMFHGRMHLFRQLDPVVKFSTLCSGLMRDIAVIEGTLGSLFDLTDMYQCDLGVNLLTQVGGRAFVARQGAGLAAGSVVSDVDSSTVVEKATTMSVSTILAMIEGILLFVIMVIFVFNKCVGSKGTSNRRGGYGY